MAGYNPFAFSQTLALLSQAMSGGDSKTSTNLSEKKGKQKLDPTTNEPMFDEKNNPMYEESNSINTENQGTRVPSLVYVMWMLLRFALAVDLGLVSYYLLLVLWRWVAAPGEP
jgi:hypothetical protein